MRETRKHIPRSLELLASGMTLRNRKRGKDYDEESIAIRDELLAIAGPPVGDGRLKGYFDLMLKTRERFFQWVCNPDVEAEYEDPVARLAQVLNAVGHDKKTSVSELLWGPKAPSTSVTKT